MEFVGSKEGKMYAIQLDRNIFLFPWTQNNCVHLQQIQNKKELYNAAPKKSQPQLNGLHILISSS